MQLSTLAIAVFASTALFSVTSAAGSGGVRGSIDDQTQARRSLDEVCSDCAGCWMSNAFWLPEKCQTQNFFNKEVDLTKADCYNMKNVGLAYGWCAAGIDRDAVIDEYIYHQTDPKNFNSATLSYATKNAATLGYYNAPYANALSTAASDCTTVTAEKDDLEAELEAELARFGVTISGLEDKLEDKDSTIESLIAELSLKLKDESPTGTSSCSQGHYMYNGECSPCNAGKRGTNGFTCEPCSAGTYNENLGQSECIPCPVDTFSDMVGSTSKLNCNNCPQGKTITTTGATTEDQCTNCPVNTYGLPVDPNSGTAGCRSCSDTGFTVRGRRGTTTCGKTGAKSFLGCAFDTPKEENPDCTEWNGSFSGSCNGGPRTTVGCQDRLYCDPNEGDERPQRSPRDDSYHSQS